MYVCTANIHNIVFVTKFANFCPKLAQIAHNGDHNVGPTPLTHSNFFPQVVVAYAADKQWLNALFCQKTPAVSDKQRQIELGTLSPGESTYRTDFFYSFPDAAN
jgi:hypothetical protein